MKKFLTMFLAALIALTPALIFAQQFPPVTIGQPFICDAASSSAVAVNTQSTNTVTVSGTNYAYICAITFAVCTNGTGTAQNQVTFTSSGISGTPSWQYSQAATASICQRWLESFGGGPLKSLQGTNVVITSPAAATNNSYNTIIYYKILPY